MPTTTTMAAALSPTRNSRSLGAGMGSTLPGASEALISRLGALQSSLKRGTMIETPCRQER